MKAYLVDAFTKRRFEGNPAGVVLDANEMSQEEKQKIASEINASETAFVSDSANADMKVEFFTPACEVAFCGHATVATFFMLGKLNKVDMKDDFVCLKQETKAGILPVEISKKDGDIRVTMTQRTPEFLDADYTDVAEALNIKEDDMDPRFPIRWSNTGNWHLIVGVKTKDCLNSIVYDPEKLGRILDRQSGTTADIFTAESGEYHCRNFCPTIGIPEDPATGAAAGAFGSYLVNEGLLESGKQSIKVVQGEAMGRPSELGILVESKDKKVEKIQVSGTAVLSFTLSAD